MPKFDIVSIPGDARLDTEQLGSKPKFWALLEGKRWLFKEAFKRGPALAQRRNSLVVYVAGQIGT